MPTCSFLLVHLGDDLPTYLGECVAQIGRFSEGPIHVAASRRHAGSIPKRATHIPVEDLPASPKQAAYATSAKLDASFRGGFWRHTSERFFIIEQVMTSLGLGNVFHLENDVMLYFDPAMYLDVFSGRYQIGATFDNDARCVPGFMYFRSTEAVAMLTTLLSRCSGFNDMQALAAIRGAVPTAMGGLPILPEDWPYELRSTSGQTTKCPGLYTNHQAEFGGIFDAAAIGQYLGGVDPRNASGDTKGFINEGCLFQANRFEFRWDKDERGRRVPVAQLGDRAIRVFNLHIHSKRLAEFRS